MTDPKFICMIDSETLNTTSKAVVLQVAFVFVPADDPETIIKSVVVHLPIDAQLALNRTIGASTLQFWAGQPNFQNLLILSNGDDFDELPALVRHLIRSFGNIVGNDGCEVWARGSDFDIAILNSLFSDLGLEAPWRYDAVRDLRTLMSAAGVTKKDVIRDEALYPQHDADADARYQLLCYSESMKHLRARS